MYIAEIKELTNCQRTIIIIKIIIFVWMWWLMSDGFYALNVWHIRHFHVIFDIVFIQTTMRLFLSSWQRIHPNCVAIWWKGIVSNHTFPCICGWLSPMCVFLFSSCSLSCFSRKKMSKNDSKASRSAGNKWNMCMVFALHIS